MKTKKKTVYLLRVRENDNAQWSEPTAFTTRLKRDNAAMYHRALLGMRTHSYEEKVAVEQTERKAE